MWLLLKEGPSGGSESLNLRKVEKLCTALVGTVGLAIVIAAIFQTPWPLLWTIPAIGAVVVLNRAFYGYLARKRGFAFAVASIGLHVLCYVVNTFSVVSGWLMHALFGEPVPPADVSAQAEVGVVTWPPGPTRPAYSVWDFQSEKTAAPETPTKPTSNLSGVDHIRGA